MLVLGKVNIGLDRLTVDPDNLGDPICGAYLISEFADAFERCPYTDVLGIYEKEEEVDYYHSVLVYFKQADHPFYIRLYIGVTQGNWIVKMGTQLSEDNIPQGGPYSHKLINYTGNNNTLIRYGEFSLYHLVIDRHAFAILSRGNKGDSDFKFAMLSIGEYINFTRYTKPYYYILMEPVNVAGSAHQYDNSFPTRFIYAGSGDGLSVYYNDKERALATCYDYYFSSSKGSPYTTTSGSVYALPMYIVVGNTREYRIMYDRLTIGEFSLFRFSLLPLFYNFASNGWLSIGSCWDGSILVPWPSEELPL